ncbi:MAG: ABC transporter ATP-binding protein/permease [Anaeroplasma bactoclasticum]|nr:ABC transporter ATP-binding protein/permease [Anaeroplasma bactoclasticum]
MLKLSHIQKTYVMGDTKVEALKGVTLQFRKNEFVSILGPSGCGKTTLLNIIGGLDKYTSGDLVINGVSTKEFNDRAWDVYRNHRIGFIFQSYNLIPHQTIVENVELALTIAGMEKAERVDRAKKALDKVGLKGQYNKKPNQLSGGQCQRVAIARALVNEPEILLADEPTGALDTTTSVQIMDLIKEISKEKLVIMVTHNPELAQKYSTRIVKLLDGKVEDDSNPCSEQEEASERDNDHTTPMLGIPSKNKNQEKAKMSFWTAFKLSFRNLLSKFKRTLMVGLAGSIGIIGVSLVLAISTGISNYIDDLQNDMLSGNPITISEQAYDINAMMNSMSNFEKMEIVVKNGFVGVNSMLQTIAKQAETMQSIMVTNQIEKEYIDYLEKMPKEYIECMSYGYGINVEYNIYTDFSENKDNDSRITSLAAIKDIYQAMLQETDYKDAASLISTLSHPIGQSLNNEDYILEQYDLLTGKMAREKNEILVVVNDETLLTDLVLAQLGYYNQEQFLNMAFKAFGAPSYNEALDKNEFSYEELLGKKFYYYPNDQIYTRNYDLRKPFTYEAYAEEFTTEGVELNVVGILRPKEGKNYGSLYSGFYYTPALTTYMLEQNKDSEIVTYMQDLEEQEIKSGSMNGITSGVMYEFEYLYEGTRKTGTGFVGSQSMNSMLSSMMPGLGGGASISLYTLSLRNVAGNDLPNSISIYPKNFEIKKSVLSYLDAWNNDGDLVVNNQTLTKDQRPQVTYTDTLSIVISMINTMINIITTALIAFTAISLIVSTVMIGIITYVSVVERVKEIGVIRSLGGRKKDVAHLFNAETFIIGGVSGLFGVGITYLISFIANMIIGSLSGLYSLVHLTIVQAIIMVSISILLTLVSGLVPSRSAAKMDPVNALRSE